MASKPTSPKINGQGQRKLTSWIEKFVEYTANLESATIFRKWSAISTIAAVLEQKVFVQTSGPLYPNLYTFLVGKPGIGKTRAIMKGAELFRELPETHLGATSMTMAALVDHLVEAKRQIIQLPDPMLEYNTLFICADELSAFMDQYDTGLIAGLTTFFDVVPYSQGRRKNDLRILIKSPQLNILSGTTPVNLIKFIPEFAWEQGFTSRVIMVYSDEALSIDVFNTSQPEGRDELIHDLKIINGLAGPFGWTEEFAKAMHDWKMLGQPPIPKHPKLEHYCTRRWSHLLKLSMVAAIDKGNSLMLTKDEFNKAMSWLLEAEMAMPEIFAAGSAGGDSKAMDEIQHYVVGFGTKGVPEHRLVNFVRERVPAYNIIRVIEIMIRSGMIEESELDEKTGLRKFRAL